MKSRPRPIRILFALLFFIGMIYAGRAEAQTASGTLRGQVTDPSGAAVAKATVTATAADGTATSAATKTDGSFEIKNLAVGVYEVQALAPGFTLYEKDGVSVAASQVQSLAISLAIQVQQQKVVVAGQSVQVDVSPENNVGAIVIKGKDLEALSDDPDELASDLTALAGPTAGPDGGQIYIDGFTAGQLPPKSAIREIRVNQNPFSAQYDKLGYGRIEIFTKPGSDQYHGSFEVSGNDSAFNSQNPFLHEAEPGYYSVNYSGNVGGPIGKKASFFFSAQRRDINDIDVVDAQVLDPNFNVVPYNAAIPNPRTRTNLGPRLDYQLTPNNTLSVRYQYYRDNEQNEGVGQFSLPSLAYNELSAEDTLQVSDTQIFGPNIVNETRFQYIRDNSTQRPLSSDPTVNVSGYFDTGGNSQGTVMDNENHYEFQNYTSIVHGTHLFKFGARLRDVQVSNSSNANFNGTYIFSTMTAYQTTEQGLANGLTPAQILAAGGGAYQYSVTAGVPLATASVFDAGLYAQDDWRVRSNLTLSYGLRFESQNDIHDHADWAPRLALAWGIGGKGKSAPKTVLRAGWGMFYDRFDEEYVLQANRLDGVRQNQYVVYSPDFFPPTVPPVAGLPQTIPALYQLAPDLRAPYIMQTALTVERQISKVANLSVNYINSRGDHEFLTNNVNAPEPGTYDPSNPQSGVRPNGVVENIFQYQSDGVFRQNQLIVNANLRASTRISLFGYYAYSKADSDTSGANSIPSNPYNISADYGRAGFDVRNRVFVGGTVALPRGFRLSPFLFASSGNPYNITLSQDLIGTTVLNQRPAFATNPTSPENVVTTALGTFDTLPAPGEKLVPINFGDGPSRFSLNLRLSKTFGFGKELGHPGGAPSRGGGRGPAAMRGFWGSMDGASERKYNLTLSVSARNVLNNVNLGTPSGVLNPPIVSGGQTIPASASPFFGVSNSLAGGPFGSSAANRLIYVQAQFSF
ncbi:MAG: carboxypeptidase regulatory-like domain-containing protein [Candidatus Acidiferrales bacterium]